MPAAGLGQVTALADAALEALLEVQGHDLSAEQLRHRRATLPARGALAEIEDALARLAVELGAAVGRASELSRVQSRLEDEIATLDQRAVETDRTLYSGAVAAPKELQWLQEESVGLRRRQRRLEDELLEVMVAAEPVVGERDRLEAEQARLEAEAEGERSSINRGEAEVDAALHSATEARAETTTRVPPDLLALYEDLRRRLHGVGAARLEHGRCGGCHLALPATELDALRRSPEGAVVRHEECGRILVR